MRFSKISPAPLLAAALLLALSGCMADPAVKTPSPGSVVVPGAASPVPSASPGGIDFTGRRMRIALCTSPATVNDRAHNAACYDGVLRFMISRNLIDSVTPLQDVTGQAETALSLAQSAVNDYDVFVCVGPAYSGLAGLAAEYPEKYFLLMDAEAQGSSDNLCCVSYAEEQCGFFAGIAAAMETSTGHIAVINSLPDDANTRYYFGFRSGVAYTNGNFGTTAELVDLPEYAGVNADGVVLGGNFTGSATDQTAAYFIASALIAQDCDVLFVAADAAGIGAYSAAGENENVWVIGSEGDQFSYGGTDDGRNFVLTSVTKHLAEETEARLAALASGNFQSGSFRLTAAENALGYITANDHQQLKEQTRLLLADAYPMMQDGTIVPGTGPQ